MSEEEFNRLIELAKKDPEEDGQEGKSIAPSVADLADRLHDAERALATANARCEALQGALRAKCKEVEELTKTLSTTSLSNDK